MHLLLRMMAPSLYDRGVPTSAGYRDVSPQEVSRARAAGNRLRVVDVREPHEYVGELGHLAGSELVPLATVGTSCASWDRQAELLLICRSGARSGRAAEQLVRAGFTHVLNMAGGMLAYNAAGLPVERQ